MGYVYGTLKESLESIRGKQSKYSKIRNKIDIRVQGQPIPTFNPYGFRLKPIRLGLGIE